MAARAGREVKGQEDRRERARGQSADGRGVRRIGRSSHRFRSPSANFDETGTGYVTLSFRLDLEHKGV